MVKTILTYNFTTYNISNKMMTKYDLGCRFVSRAQWDARSPTGVSYMSDDVIMNTIIDRGNNIY